MVPAIHVPGVRWQEAVGNLVTAGWCRLPRAIPSEVAAELEAAAPESWEPVPPVEGPGRVRQAGSGSHSDIGIAAPIVQELSTVICRAIEGAAPVGTPELPAFNHAEWGRPDQGQMYIGPHRDPATAEGVVVIVTLRGRALFRVWDVNGELTAGAARPESANEWGTGDGDIVVLLGGRWPTAESRRPFHEAQMPAGADRVTLTLRHNKGGFGASYFD